MLLVDKRCFTNYTRSLRLAWVIGNQNEHFGMRSSRENHFQGVVLQCLHRRLSISSLTRWKHSLTVEKYFIAADFVRASPVAVCNS